MTDETFATVFPVTKTADLAVQLGVSVSSVEKRAKRLGLRKSREHRGAVISAARSGVKHTDESRAKMSTAKAGRPGHRHTEATIAKIRTANSGERHYNWKGGTPGSRYATPGYRAWQCAVLERDGFTCQRCGHTSPRGFRLHAHHLKAWIDYPALRLDIDNGVTLCEDCHAAVHGRPAPVHPTVLCACGCGEAIPATGLHGRKRRYVSGHQRRGAILTPETRAAISARLTGRPLDAERYTKLVARNRSASQRAAVSVAARRPRT